MTGTEASTSPPALPRWFGPRASAHDPAVSALIEGVARGAGWTDIGGAFNLNVRIDAEPPVVLRVHRPWVRRGRVAGLRRLRERLQGTQARVAGPIPISGGDLYDISATMNHVVQSGPDRVGPPIELLDPRRLLYAYERTAPQPLTPDEHRWLPGALALIPLHWAATAGLVENGVDEAENAMTAAEAWWSRRAELSP